MKVFLSGVSGEFDAAAHGFDEVVDSRDYPEGLTGSSVRRWALRDMLTCDAVYFGGITTQSKWELLTARFLGLPVIGDGMAEEENLEDILAVAGAAALTVWDVMTANQSSGKYGPGVWKEVSDTEHILRAARHAVTAAGQVTGDISSPENHVANALSRLAMVMAKRCG